MKYNVVDLSKHYKLSGGSLACILMDEPYDRNGERWNRPAVIVVPGGGYGMVSKREGEPRAFSFLDKGFQTFVLEYTIGGENGKSYPEQLLELAAAVDYVKKNAQSMRINPDEIFVVGFSAGGHLAGNLCVEYHTVAEKYGAPLDCKPTAAGLCYPVISYIDGHLGSYENLLYGYTDEAKTELLKTLCLDESVTDKTPPAFLWTTAEDKCVPPSNALRYAMALNKVGVPYELHVYPKGGHGLSTCLPEVNYGNAAYVRNAVWMQDCANFFLSFCRERFHD